jgi:hypothetical protein|tara:strand:- start:968 stop:1162 length:195 start_codon:yes stop_codon:yes gene_type:complete
MGSKPKAAPKPDPATVATSVDEDAKRRAELERRKRGGFYSQFRRRDSSASGATSAPGGDNQSVG